MTSGGAFSPYASDGKKIITLRVVDTEYSILDAIFYPWLKDINSPWWYRPDKVYTEWATPYPMATLEIQRPRMRYRDVSSEGDKKKDSRNESDYTYYSYKFNQNLFVTYYSYKFGFTKKDQLTPILSIYHIPLPARHKTAKNKGLST